MSGEKEPAKRLKIDWVTVIPYVVLAGLYGALVTMNPKLLTMYWIGLKTNDALALILVAIGQTIVLIQGGIDLSVGGVVCLTNCLSSLYLKDDPASMIAVSLGCLALGYGIGLANGYAIARTKMQPFIVTLAGWSILGGISLWLLPTDGGAAPEGYMGVLLSRPLGIPLSIYIIVGLIALWQYVKRTPFGMSVYAVGSSEKSAHLNGIKVNWVKMQSYAACGLLAAAAGLYRTAQVASGSPLAGNNFIMPAIVAAVIGGTSLNGGRGGIVGSIAGALVLKLITDVLVFMGVSSYWSTLCQGLLLIFAVILSSVTTMARQRELKV